MYDAAVQDWWRAGPGDAVGSDPVAEAFRTWMRACARPDWGGSLETEVVDVARAVRRVTAEAVRALWPLPAYHAAAMDGIAVRACDTRGAEGERVRLAVSQYDRVDTGDPMPDGRDAVIMAEFVEFAEDDAALVPAGVAPGRHVRAAGEDLEAGQAVLSAGHRIRPVDVAALAGAGHTAVRVRRRPVVAILPTGDELRPLGAVPAPGEVLDTNSLMLAGMVDEAGGEPVRLPIAPDHPDRIADAVAAASAAADLVLILSGSSAGRGDFTATVVRRLGQVAVHGVAMRPGHPVLLGVLTSVRPERVPVIGVPGYPLSAERAFTSFAMPLLRRMLGEAEPAQDGVPARLASDVPSAGHLDEYVRVRLARVLDPRLGLDSLVATPLRRGAGALGSMVRAEAVLRIPAGQDGLTAGAPVLPVPVGGAAFATMTILVSGIVTRATSVLTRVAGRDCEGAVQWTEAPPVAAADALVDGLCHAVALSLAHEGEQPVADEVAHLADRIGEITVLEIARTDARVEVLVVPAGAFDSPAVTTLRTVLRSTDFRQGLLACVGYSARSSGRETIHAPRYAAPAHPME